MPERERVFFARLGENSCEVGGMLLRRGVREVETGERFAELGAGVFLIGRARAYLRFRCTCCAGGNERFAAFEFETNPPQGRTDGASTSVIDVERVGAAEIDGDGRGRVDDELAG